MLACVRTPLGERCTPAGGASKSGVAAPGGPQGLDKRMSWRLLLRRKRDPHSVYLRLLDKLRDAEGVTVYRRALHMFSSDSYMVRLGLAIAGDIATLSRLVIARSERSFV